MKNARTTKKASKNTGRAQAAINNGELLAWHESQPPPQINLEVLDAFEKGRGQRSHGRK